MAEVLGIASGVAGLISLTGQIAHGIQQIHSFFSEFKDASSNVQQLLTELDNLQVVLKTSSICAIELEKHGCRDGGYRAALHGAEQQILVLLEAVQKHRQEQALSKQQAFWKKLTFVMKSKEFSKKIIQLERTKMLVQAAQRNMESMLLQQQYITLRSLHDSHANHRTEYASFSGSFQQTSQRVERLDEDFRIVKNNLLSLNQSVRESRNGSKVLGKHGGLGPVHQRIEDLGGEMQEVKRAVQGIMKRLDSGDNEKGSLPQLLTKQIEFSIQSAIGEHMARQHLEKGHSLQSGNTEIAPPCPDLGPPAILNDFEGGKLGSGSKSTFRTQKQMLTKRTGFFGTLTVRTSIVESVSTTHGEHDESSDSAVHSETHRTDVTFIPVSWLFQRGIIATLNKISVEYSRPSFNINIEPFRVIVEDAPIVKACLGGDLAEVRRLFRDGKASPFDRTTTGQTLLHCVLYDKDFLAKPCHLRTKDLLSERRSLAMARFLINSNVDAGAQDFFGRTPLQLLMFTFSHNRFKLGVHQEHIDSLARLIISKAKRNPFALDRHGENAISELCTYPEVWERHHQLFRFMILGQTDWDIDYNESGRMGDSLLSSMVRLHVANDSNSEMALQRRTTDFRVMLQTRENFNGAPLNSHAPLVEALRQGGTALRKDPFLKTRIRDAVYRNLITLLEAGFDIYAMDDDNNLPTNEARKSNLLDIWRMALLKCGYDPEVVIHDHDNLKLLNLYWSDQEISFHLDSPDPILVNAIRQAGRALGAHEDFNDRVKETLLSNLIRSIRRGADLNQIREPTTTEVAWRRGVLHAWRAALIECGYDADATIEAHEELEIARVYWSEDEMQRRLSVDSPRATVAIEEEIVAFGFDGYSIKHKLASPGFIEITPKTTEAEYQKTIERLQARLVSILTDGTDLRLRKHSQEQSATEAAHWYGLISTWRTALESTKHNADQIIHTHDHNTILGLRWTTAKTKWQLEYGESSLPAAVFQAGKSLGADENFNLRIKDTLLNNVLRCMEFGADLREKDTLDWTAAEWARHYKLSDVLIEALTRHVSKSRSIAMERPIPSGTASEYSIEDWYSCVSDGSVDGSRLENFLYENQELGSKNEALINLGQEDDLIDLFN